MSFGQIMSWVGNASAVNSALGSVAIVRRDKGLLVAPPGKDPDKSSKGVADNDDFVQTSSAAGNERWTSDEVRSRRLLL